jgi:hypothetical protein
MDRIIDSHQAFFYMILPHFYKETSESETGRTGDFTFHHFVSPLTEPIQAKRIVALNVKLFLRQP